MKRKKFPQLSLEELKNTMARSDYEKPGVHAIGGGLVPGGCVDGDSNAGPDGCVDGNSNSGSGGCVSGNSNGGAPAGDIIY